MKLCSRIQPTLRRIIIYDNFKLQTQQQRPVLQSHLHPSYATSAYSTSSHNPSSSSTMDTSETKPQNTSETQPSTTPASLPGPPPLPPADDNTSSTVEVGGAALRLDKLGPLVVNEDGTVSRIANWEKMADIERENTLRILGKRNQMRLAKLRGEAAQQQPGNSETQPEQEADKK
ncbi:hypothetical protein GGR55DRAFT_176851 [Xylaria sp. FL0064]|nr:hypothetical protein GGR55DRAFT_176851 [Xylaria sp. FL0064]